MWLIMHNYRIDSKKKKRNSNCSHIDENDQTSYRKIKQKSSERVHL